MHSMRRVFRALCGGKCSASPVVIAAMASALLALNGCSSRAQQGTGPRAFAVTHVTVIDATGAPEHPDMTVVVQHGRITTVRASNQTTLPPGLPTVDGRGRFLIPGLNDMHAHNTWDTHFNGPLMIANGVTGVRDMFAYDIRLIDERRREVAAGALHPNILAAGPIVDGDPPSWPHSIVVHNAAEAVRAVDDVKRAGYDFVKVYSQLNRESHFAIAKEAKRIGIPFAGHVPDLITASEASDAGQRSIEHLMDIGVSCSTEEARMRNEAAQAASNGTVQTTWLAHQVEAVDTFDEPKCQALYRKLVANQTWQVPTLSVERINGGMTDPNITHPPNLKYVPYLLKWIWQAAVASIASSITPEQASQNHRAFVDHLLKLVGEMHRAGVPIMTGTDNPNPFVIPGFSLHDELRSFVQAGFTPMAALQASTLMPAKFLGRLDRMGTIEEGKDANLVLLDADPLLDIDNTRKINAVVLNGQFLSRAVLQSLLDKARADRWYPNPAAMSLLTVILAHAKYYLFAALAVLCALIGSIVYFIRRRRAMKATA